MDNDAIADNLSLLSRLMEIHGENSFKAKSYAIAAFNIEKLPFSLKDTPAEKVYQIKGIGEAIGQKILQMLRESSFPLLDEYLAKTPAGILEMLHIKGLGPKKIAVLWKELGIETIGELLYACNENRLLLYKGFGAKTQENICRNIEFYLSNQGRFLFAEIEAAGYAIEKRLQNMFPQEQVMLTGSFRRNEEIIDEIAFVTTANGDVLYNAFATTDLQVITKDESSLLLQTPEKLKIRLHTGRPENIGSLLLLTTGSDAFLADFSQAAPLEDQSTEEALFKKAGLPFIPPYLREGLNEIRAAENNSLPEPLQTSHIKGIIHAHSNWSDGSYSLEEMAETCRTQGFEYLVISDHSQAAAYANGLSPERIAAQHAQIDELNARLAPFRIFKSIEADILNNGQLDYGEDILKSFDLVIASVHSNLKTTEEKAMARLLAAIENPYTTILGHMTGRLLLSRNGYPVDHRRIIDACAAYHVVIELNAHPRRLDIDWRWIPYALEREVLISIDPDAHKTEGFNDIYYGVLAARKAGLTKEHNLSSFTLAAFEDFLARQKQWKGR